VSREFAEEGKGREGEGKVERDEGERRTELLPLRLSLQRNLSSSIQDDVHELVESL